MSVIAWGNRVSAPFRQRVLAMANDLNMPPDGPDWLMACMAFETANTFSPSIRNAAGSGAVGLIQFMPHIAFLLATSTEKLAHMTAEEQLEYVHKYLKPYAGRLLTFEDVYMAILWPAAIGKPSDFVLWSKATKPLAYRQNIGLDMDRDGDVTKAEAARMAHRKLILGLEPRHLA